MLHGRNGQNGEMAYQDILQTLRAEKCQRGLIHCFGGTRAEAEEFLAQGFCIGFTGIVTFKKKAEELQAIAQLVPLDRLIIEPIRLIWRRSRIGVNVTSRSG
jgi:Tat protein secretion system quality control protein TatD with DNase activity